MTENTIHIYIDADACPVKDEIYKVAARHALPVTVVAGGFIRVPQDPMIERVAAGAGMDAADDWIVERAGPASIVVFESATAVSATFASSGVGGVASATGPESPLEGEEPGRDAT